MSTILKLNDTHRRLLSAIRQNQTITRVELSRLLAIGTGPVTQLTRELMLAGLIVEGDRLRGGRGQPALPLMLEPSGAISFGVSLSPGRVIALGVDFCGAIVAEREWKLTTQRPQDIAEEVERAIAEILKQKAMSDRSRVLGVGFALPGFFLADHQHMEVVGQSTSWSDIDLKEVFQAELGLPCWIENDATAAAIGEYYENGRQAKQCLVSILINYGIGAGLIINGHPFRGAFGNAGEIGSFFPLDAPRPSGNDLLATMRAAGITCDALHEFNWEDPDHARIGSAWAERSGAQIAELVATAWSWLDPDVITISGSIPGPLIERLVESFHVQGLFTRQPNRPNPALQASKRGAEVVAIGASHLPLHHATGHTNGIQT